LSKNSGVNYKYAFHNDFLFILLYFPLSASHFPSFPLAFFCMKIPFIPLAPLSLAAVIAIFAGTPLIAQSTDSSSRRADLSAEAAKPPLDALTAELNGAPSPVSPPPDNSVAYAEPAKMVPIFFKQLELNRVNGAYDELLRGSKIAEVKEDVDNLKGKTREAIRNFGDIIGYELVQSKPVGGHLLSLTYLSIGKNYPIRWRFFFYKATDSWRLIDIRISDRLMDMFQEPLPVAPVPASAP
jgi:hypothetical protein